MIPRFYSRLALGIGGALLLAVSLDGRFVGVPGIVILGAAWVLLVLATILPSRSERVRRELARRLAEFRDELHAIGDEPTRPAIERLLARGSELGLSDAEIGEEIAELRACLDALDLRDRLSCGELPIVESREAIAAGDVCYFTARVRCGRRRADHVGDLVMTPSGLHFRGISDVRAMWSDLESVQRAGREVVISLHGSTRVLRFPCHSHADAAHAGVIAQHLSQLARACASIGPAGDQLPL